MGKGIKENENRLKLSIPFGVVLVFYHSVICEGCGSNKTKMRISCLIFKNKVLHSQTWEPAGWSDAFCSHCSPLRSGEYWWLELPALPRKKGTNAFVSTPLPGDSPVTSITRPTWKEFSSLSPPPVFCKCPCVKVMLSVQKSSAKCPPCSLPSLSSGYTLLLGCCLSSAVWAKILTRS